MSYRHAHPLTKTAQGLLLDFYDRPSRELFNEFDTVLTKATDAAKDVEAERDRLTFAAREAIAAIDAGAPLDARRELLAVLADPERSVKRPPD